MMNTRFGRPVMNPTDRVNFDAGNETLESVKAALKDYVLHSPADRFVFTWKRALKGVNKYLVTMLTRNEMLEDATLEALAPMWDVQENQSHDEVFRSRRSHGGRGNSTGAHGVTKLFLENEHFWFEADEDDFKEAKAAAKRKYGAVANDGHAVEFLIRAHLHGKHTGKKEKYDVAKGNVKYESKYLSGGCRTYGDGRMFFDEER